MYGSTCVCVQAAVTGVVIQISTGEFEPIQARLRRMFRALRNERVVFTTDGPGCSPEAQDFFDDDRTLSYSCYEPEGRASVWTLDLATGERVNQSAAIGSYNEVEGIFPDGRFSAALSFTMLHHVPSAELQDRLFAEVARVLQPGGFLAGVDSLDSEDFRALHDGVDG